MRKYLEIINGSLLGDGCLIGRKNNNCNSALHLSQSVLDNNNIDKKKYLQYLKTNIPFPSSEIKKKRYCSKELSKLNKKSKYLSKKFSIYRLQFSKNEFWTNLEKKWYVPRNGHKFYYRTKIVPKDLILTPLTLCIWFIDDGSNDAKRGIINLCTQGFTFEENKFLQNRLKEDLNINSSIHKTRNKFKIYVSIDSYHKFLELIKPYVEWDCFKYKLDSSYIRNKKFGEFHKLSKMTNKQVNKIFEFKKQGLLNKNIAKLLNISPSTVSNILRGKNWKHIGKTLIKNKGFKKANEKLKQYIFKLYNEGKTHKEIGHIVGKCQSTISRIIKKEFKCQELI